MYQFIDCLCLVARTCRLGKEYGYGYGKEKNIVFSSNKAAKGQYHWESPAVWILSACIFSSFTLYISGNAYVKEEMERLGFGELTIWVNGERKEAYGGIHCKEVFEFKLNDVWIPARVEMDDDRKWYLVGLPGRKLDGLEVRCG